MNRLRARTWALLFSICIVAPAVRADVIVGEPANTGDCAPFGCAVFFTEYQQVYTSNQFSGPITITDLEFFNTFFNFNATAINSGTWTISLSTTSADWNTLSSNTADNVGADNTTVFSGNLAQPWTFGDTLEILLSAPYTYDPSNGNLLMDVQISSSSLSGGLIYFDASDPNTIMGTVVNSSVSSGSGLVTGFSTDETAVPEPATFLFLGTALVGLAPRIRKGLGKV